MVSLIIVVVLAGMAAAIFSLSLSRTAETQRAGSRLRALYMAEAGVGEAMMSVADAVINVKGDPVNVGAKSAPRELKNGAFWTTIADNGDGTYTVFSQGIAADEERAIQVVLEPDGDSPFDHAIFAGNTSGDPNYTLRLSGEGAARDRVVGGDVYSGGDIELALDASVDGNVITPNTVTTGSGHVGGVVEGVTLPTPDIASMAYEMNHDYDVAALFAADETYGSGSPGGDAWQLPESNPAHIFRKNPSDRSSENSGTTKDDFYLEDRFEPIGKDSNQDGTDPWDITFTGNTGNDKVFYVDGNLWIHNSPTYSFRFKNEDGAPVRAVFIVKGNVTFSDNLFYDDRDQDAAVFIAIEDPAVPDSGNIYFGDPGGGTLEYMDAFMYAENDFEDTHLDRSGSKDVTIHGTMTAGNHVYIERDFTHSDGTVSHSTLTVDFDDRIRRGVLEMNGLPTPGGGGIDGFRLIHWQEVPTQ